MTHGDKLQEKCLGQCSLQQKHFLCKRSRLLHCKDGEGSVCMAGKLNTDMAISQWCCGREKAMPVKVGVKTVSDVQEHCIQAAPFS